MAHSTRPARPLLPTVPQFHFDDEGARLRPYIGMGFDYTWFRSVKSKLAPEVSMTDSFGLAAHAGLDYSVFKSWRLFVSIARVDVRSEVTAIGVNVLTSSIDFRPWTYSAGAYFKF